MTITKTLANCGLADFLRQSIKIKDTASEWIEKTDFFTKLRDKASLTGDESEEERKRIVHEQFTANLNNAVTDALSGENADLTARLMALCCFVDEEDMDKYQSIDFVVAFMEMLRNESVLGFFTSLAKTELRGTSGN